MWSRDADRNDAAVEELDPYGPAAGFVCDVADRASVDAALAATLDRFDRVDALFANAGTSGAVRFEEMTEEEWRTGHRRQRHGALLDVPSGRPTR